MAPPIAVGRVLRGNTSLAWELVAALLVVMVTCQAAVPHLAAPAHLADTALRPPSAHLVLLESTAGPPPIAAPVAPLAPQANPAQGGAVAVPLVRMPITGCLVTTALLESTPVRALTIALPPPPATTLALRVAPTTHALLASTRTQAQAGAPGVLQADTPLSLLRPPAGHAPPDNISHTHVEKMGANAATAAPPAPTHRPGQRRALIARQATIAPLPITVAIPVLRVGTLQPRRMLVPVAPQVLTSHPLLRPIA